MSIICFLLTFHFICLISYFLLTIHLLHQQFHSHPIHSNHTKIYQFLLHCLSLLHYFILFFHYDIRSLFFLSFVSNFQNARFLKQSICHI